MSATAPQDKRPLEQAKAEAMAFAALLKDCSERWIIAGSIRRGKRTVGDVEHVVIPKMLREGGGDRNLLWERLDSLLEAAGDQGLFASPSGEPITKAIYRDGKTRYGPKLRGVMFRGFRHEIYTADERNWGCILAIRTGSADFGPHCMASLNAGGRHAHLGGYIRDVHAGGAIVSCPDEETFFEMCGVRMLDPHEREIETIRKGGARR